MKKKIAFLSYRNYLSSDYENALKAKKYLMEYHNYVDVHLFRPNSLCEQGELLLPYEYYELMGWIRDRIAECTAFYYLETPNYTDSYFTQAELLQWQAYRNNPVVYGIKPHGNSFVVGSEIPIGDISNDQKQLIAHFAVSIDRSQKSRFNPGFVGGKFNRNCFLIPCGNCGEHFLASQKFVYNVLRGAERLSCPHCYNTNFRVYEMNKRGEFYRKPIILEQPRPYKTDLRILGIHEIHQLLASNDLPSGIKLLNESNEQLTSDMGKLGKAWAAIGLAVGVGVLVASLFSKDRD